MPAAFNGSGKCNKCGLTAPDCATGFSGPHTEIQVLEDTVWNGRTILNGQKITLPSAVWSAHKGKHTVTNGSA